MINLIVTKDILDLDLRAGDLLFGDGEGSFTYEVPVKLFGEVPVVVESSYDFNSTIPHIVAGDLVEYSDDPAVDYEEEFLTPLDL